MCGDASAKSPHEAFFYYRKNNLEAVRCGKWKLHVYRVKETVQELYNLEADIGELTNVYDQEPDVVRDLNARIDACRKELGDEATGTTQPAFDPRSRGLAGPGSWSVTR